MLGSVLGNTDVELSQIDSLVELIWCLNISIWWKIVNSLPRWNFRWRSYLTHLQGTKVFVQECDLRLNISFTNLTNFYLQMLWAWSWSDFWLVSLFFASPNSKPTIMVECKLLGTVSDGLWRHGHLERWRGQGDLFWCSNWIKTWSNHHFLWINMDEFWIKYMIIIIFFPN